MTSVSVSQFYTTAEILPASTSSESSELTLLQGFDENQLSNFFNVEESISWIKDNNLKRIALQFPDSFVPFASKLSLIFESSTSAKTFILADTSYRSCCVDEVAAAHASCDGIIHYGDACLSAPCSEKILIKYVLGHLPVDINDLHAKLEENMSAAEGSYVLFADVPYDHCLDNTSSFLTSTFKNVNLLIAKAVVPNEDSSISNEFVQSLGRRVPSSLIDIESCNAIFIGSSSSPLLAIWLMTYPQCVSVTIYDPIEKRCEVHPSYALRQLRKRLFLVEKLKDANTVGLIVGSVNVGGHKDAVDRIRKLCKTAGKKSYVISVGKINVPKLSNFTSDIDIFILLSCPFGIMLDCSDYFRPVLSMFEAEAALNPSCSWFAGKGWTADFAKFIDDSIGERDEDSTDVSLLTGTIRGGRVVDDSLPGQTQMAVYTAGDYFKQRTWKGLDDSVRSNETTDIVEGRAGIAVSYQNEPEKEKS